MSSSVPAVLALVLVGPVPALDPKPLDVAAFVQREIDDDTRLERERQRCLLAQHRVRLRSRGGDFERGAWRFAQNPLDVAEDASRCALESARQGRFASADGEGRRGISAPGRGAP